MEKCDLDVRSLGQADWALTGVANGNALMRVALTVGCLPEHVPADFTLGVQRWFGRLSKAAQTEGFYASQISPNFFR